MPAAPAPLNALALARPQDPFWTYRTLPNGYGCATAGRPLGSISSRS
nr:hypothetical protein [Zymomonas mobilis]